MLPSSTESAVANGDTRTIYLYHAHTHESIDATYRVDGHYDPEVLKKLNWFLRDWRRNEETTMDPRLFDAVWETYRGAGATQRIVVLCGFRSPETNAMLRRRSRAVAEHSQHILGKAMDTTMPGMSMEHVREAAVRLQLGGVGYYGNTNFVHIDVGGVRMWPRMSYAQLMRLFPDGKTVHVASDGRTLPGYEEARAELAASGTAIASLPPPQKSGVGAFFAWLFGKGNGGDDEDAATAQQSPSAPAPQSIQEAAAPQAVSQQQAASPPQSAGAPEPAMQADATDSAPDRTTPIAAPGEAVAMPLPPERPDNLVAAADVPLPPERPSLQLAALSPDTVPLPLARPAPAAMPQAQTQAQATTAQPEADLPGIITDGPSDGRRRQPLSRTYGLPAQALAYAPAVRMEGLRSAARDPAVTRAFSGTTNTATEPARLDGSNFRSLTGSTDLSELTSGTTFGPTLTGLRSAARVRTAALSAHPDAGYHERFQPAPKTLPVNQFSGAAVAALAPGNSASGGR